MPPVLIAFFILIGASTGPPLVKGLTTPPDSSSRPRYGKPAPVEYRTWTSSPRRDKKGNCSFTIFALVTREKLTRLRVQGEEKLLDWSWSWDADVPAGFRGEGMTVEFIDPVGGAVLATHEISETCWTLAPQNQEGW